MNNWVSLSNYTPYYVYAMGIIVVFTLLSLVFKRVDYTVRDSPMGFWTFLLFSAILLYVGLRPISGRVFADMGVYNRFFLAYQSGLVPIPGQKDFFFHLGTYLAAQIMSNHSYFFLCALLYIFPMYIVSKKWFGAYKYYAFLLLIISFSFWGYGTNGIRNGISTSMLLWAFTQKKWIPRLALFFIAYAFHGSAMIPIAAYVISLFYKNTKTYMWVWLACIPISLAFGNSLEGFLGGLSIDDRTEYLTLEEGAEGYFRTGFRPDFLLYGAVPIIMAYFFIIRDKWYNKTYMQLMHIYITANAFWILVMRANFSNRFAYLSWFMMAIVTLYPLIFSPHIKNKNQAMALLIAGTYLFTFIMFL